MAIYSNPWQLMTIYGNSWQLVAIYVNLWQLITVCGNLWQLLAIYGNLFMEIYGKYAAKDHSLVKFAFVDVDFAINAIEARLAFARIAVNQIVTCRFVLAWIALALVYVDLAVQALRTFHAEAVVSENKEKATRSRRRCSGRQQNFCRITRIIINKY